jgi:hypothetical protein
VLSDGLWGDRETVYVALLDIPTRQFAVIGLDCPLGRELNAIALPLLDTHPKEKRQFVFDRALVTISGRLSKALRSMFIRARFRPARAVIATLHSSAALLALPPRCRHSSGNGSVGRLRPHGCCAIPTGSVPVDSGNSRLCRHAFGRDDHHLTAGLQHVHSDIIEEVVDFGIIELV